MILTPIDTERLPQIIEAFDVALAQAPGARAVFRRIAETQRFAPGLKADLHAGRGKAIALAKQFDIPTIDEDPAAAFSWDGRAIRTRSETSVVFHEIAHWQIAPLERRQRRDFGLGAGPETGLIDAANGDVCVDNATKEEEENLASLLGILWEAAYAEPAILAFAEQNWLELYDRPHTARHFVACLAKLEERGLVIDGWPQPAAAQARPAA